MNEYVILTDSGADLPREVAKRYEHLAVLDRCRNTDRARKLLVIRNDSLDRLRALMSLVHIVHVIGGGNDAILAAR